MNGHTGCTPLGAHFDCITKMTPVPADSSGRCNSETGHPEVKGPTKASFKNSNPDLRIIYFFSLELRQHSKTAATLWR